METTRQPLEGADTRPDSLWEELGRASRIRYLLVAAVVIQLILLGSLAKERDLAWATVRERVESVRIRFQARRDPAVGSRIDLKGIGIPDTRSVPQGIMVVSTCEACNIRWAERWARVLRSKEIRRLLIVSREQPVGPGRAEIAKRCSAAGVTTSVLWDRSGAAAKALNAFFSPRCYQLDSRERLVWIQQWREEIPEFVEPFKPRPL
jgi:hypothetical protein